MDDHLNTFLERNWHGPIGDFGEWDPAQARERVWHAACQAGRCRYAAADVRDENPPPIDSTTNCGGYHGQKYTNSDGGPALWRWRPCVRHLDWWERRKVWLRAQRERAQGGKTGRGWKAE